MNALWHSRLTSALAGKAGWHTAANGLYQCWCPQELAEFAPWNLPWAEVRKHPELFEDPKLFKMSSRRTVVRTALAGRTLFVKRSLVLGAKERLRAPLVLPKEAQELLLATEWIAAGINVPQPAFFAVGPDPVKPCSARFYATEPLPDGLVEAKEHFAQHGFDGPELEFIARETARLHAIPAFHADYRTDHLYLGAEALWFIDLDRSSIGAVPSTRDREQALLQFFQSLIPAGVSEAEGVRFFGAYDPEGKHQIDGAALVRQARSNWEAITASRPPSRKK